jgi:hypothetical protein
MWEADPTKSIKEQILSYVQTYETATFAEFSLCIPGFRYEGDGSCDLVSVPYPNIVFWTNLSEAALAAMKELREEGAIFMHPAHPLSYLYDGAMLKLPLARRSQNYKKPHWCPVCFCTYPMKSKKSPK